jgi:hypothetical protein
MLPRRLRLVHLVLSALIVVSTFLTRRIGRPLFYRGSKYFDTTREKQFSLALDPGCSIYQDITGIYHHPESASVSVSLRSNASDDVDRRACLRPYLVARLSGPAVGVVHEWTYRQGSEENSTVIEGHYDVPMPGEYFLEIIVILCNTYDEQLLRQAQNYTYSDGHNASEAAAAFEREKQHIVEHCVENPEHNRLTALNASIGVIKTSRPRQPAAETRDSWKVDMDSPQGYWMRDTSSSRPQETVYEPLYTRYQPGECHGGRTGDCSLPAASQTRFEPYRFTWTVPKDGRPFGDEILNDTADLGTELRLWSDLRVLDEKILRGSVRRKSLANPNDTFCLVGDSHTMQLAPSIRQFVSNPVTYIEINLAFILGENITLGDPTKSVAERVIQQLEGALGSTLGDCSFLVIQIAHWDASYFGGYPTGVSLYERNIFKTIFKTCRWHFRILESLYGARIPWHWEHVSFCSLPTIPLPLLPLTVDMCAPGIWLNCPHMDWRNPALIDFYKEALQRAVAAAAARSSPPPVYLDTSFITAPMWDFALDYSHSDVRVTRARSLFIAESLLGAF